MGRNLSWASGAWADDAWFGTAWSTGADLGTPITNAGATTDVPKNYEICDRTGFRMLPQHDRLSKMRIEWTGYGVRADSKDTRNAQDYISSRQDIQEGPQSPENNDQFISDSVGPEDL